MSFFVAKNIIKNYANHRALDDVSIEIPEGAIYGLLGPNGAGKTSLIRIINQITGPDSGELYFKDHKLEPADMNRIGYLPEERGLYKKMKVGEQAVYLARLKGVSRHDAIQQLKAWFEKFGIEAWWDRKVEELSKGMAQKVQFITTVLHEPEMLIFDEPFSGFDPINVELLKKEILELRKQGATIIFSTHNMSSVEELCDEITLINRSKAVLQGEVNDIREKHKKNIFRIAIQDGNLPADPDKYDILETQAYRRGSISTIAKKEMSNSELIGYLNEHYQLTAFEEILPTMNEIFIDTVGASALNEDNNQ